MQTVSSGVSSSTFKNKMLSLLNQYRTTTKKGNTPGQPAASYMKTLSWDNNLAKVAQGWADQCNWYHNSQATSQYKSYSGKSSGGVAENMYASTYSLSITNLKKSVTAWYDEYKTYTFQNKQATQTNHYTIMMNADTTKVGCAYKVCNQLSGSSLSGSNGVTVVVCDFWDGTNRLGSPYLKKGTSSFTYEDETQSGLAGDEIAAIVSCVCICLCVMAGLVWFRRRRMNAKKNMDNMKEEVADIEHDDEETGGDSTNNAENTLATPVSDDEAIEIDVNACGWGS